MSTSEVFTLTCTRLEEATALSRIEARGTVRLALKAAGLDAGSVTAAQMAVVLERVLPQELVLRGIEDPEAVCGEIRSRVIDLKPSSSHEETPDAVFARLGSS